VAVTGAGRARADEAPDAPRAPMASDMPAAFGADQVRFDARGQALEASGHVHVDQPPFHLTGDAFALRRVPIGVALVGKGTVAFCPCLGTPLAIHFEGATLAPPHDLVLHNPVLELYGVPIAWAPAIWLRSPGRAGLLAPDLAWRGADGLFIGEGVHLPWRSGDLTRGLDLRAGLYADGGAAVQLVLRTTVTDTRVAWDWLRGSGAREPAGAAGAADADDGVTLALRGATAIAGGDRPESAAWQVDALRGARAVQAVTDVGAAALPFDHAEAQEAWHGGGWAFASGVRTFAARGGDLLDLGAGGPVVTARRSDAIAHAGAYDATIEGGVVDGRGVGATSFARAEGGTLLATRLGPVGTALAIRALGDVANDGRRTGTDGAAQARLTAGLPLEREFRSADAGDAADAWVHRTEPTIAAAAIAAHASDVLAAPAGRGATGPTGGAWVAAAGWSNALARRGSSSAAELDVSGGAVGDDRSATPVVRARAASSGRWLGLSADLARVVAPGERGGGGALVARARVGPAAALHVSAHVAERDGVDPVVARTIVDAPLEPASGFLAATGWTGGASVGVPLGARVTARGGADVDLAAGQLVAALGAIELHDPCGCVVVRASAAHRVGREGVDVWLSVDLPSP
jgi:hypothetical protein